MYLRGIRCAAWVTICLFLFIQGNAIFSGGEEASMSKAFKEYDESAIIIESVTIVENKNWDIKQDIVVKPGAVLIINSTRMTFDTTAENISVIVEPGGKLYINSCELTSTKIYKYSIEIYGSIEINNTRVSLCGYSTLYLGINDITDGILIWNGSATFTDSSFDFNDLIYSFNSNLIIKDTTISNSSNAIIASDINLTIENSSFIDNHSDLELYSCRNLSISDSSFDSLNLYQLQPWDYFSGISLNEYCSGIIDNCLFYGKQNALNSYLSEIVVNHSVFYFNEKDIKMFYSDMHIENTRFDYPTAPDDEFMYAYDKYGGIECEGGILHVDNSSFNNLTTCIYVTTSFYGYEASAAINDSKFTNSGTGIAVEGGIVTCDNLTVQKNGIGFQFAWGTRCNISNSDISLNNIGLTSDWALVYLENNFIGKNTGWGIVNSGYWFNEESSELKDTFNYIGENFPASSGKNYETLRNAIGNFAQLKRFDVVVTDENERPLGVIDIALENERHSELNANGDIYSVTSTTTDFGGYAQMGMLIEYLIIDDYEKEFCGDYKLTASYPLTGNLRLENITYIDPATVYNKMEIHLQLPNLYLNESRFTLSSDSVKPGETLTVNTALHYTGPQYLTLPPINISLYIDGVLVDSVPINTPAGGSLEQPVELTWKAETGNVPMAKSVDERQVKIVIDMPEGLEYDKGTFDFIRDNSISTRVKIELEPEPDEWTLTSGSPFASIVFFFMIILVVFIIVFLIRYIILKKTIKKEQLEFAPDEEVQRHRGPNLAGRPPIRGRVEFSRVQDGPPAGRMERAPGYRRPRHPADRGRRPKREDRGHGGPERRRKVFE